jgi:hypothetical protein
LERVYNSGKWKGLTATVTFNNVADPAQWWADESVKYLTLPRPYQSVSGIQFGVTGMPATPRLIYPRWQEFIVGGPGQLSAGLSMQMAVDLGDEFCVYSTPTAPHYLRFEISDTDDVGQIVKIIALDPSGKPLVSASGDAHLSVTLSATGATLVSSKIGSLVAVHKPVTQGFVRVYAVNPDNSAQKAQIADYEPTEQIPRYKRYKLGAAESATVVNCLCKRRYVPLVNGPDDEKVIVPDNEGALKLVLMSLQYEDKNDLERAEVYFQKAVQLLNAELKQDMGTPVITLQMNPMGAAMRVPQRY